MSLPVRIPTESPQKLTVAGKPFVLIEEAEYRRLILKAGEGFPFPGPDAAGNYPARETLTALIADGIARQRKALGLTQAELARRAGLRQETLSRIEQGKHAPSVPTVDKIDQALRDAERDQAGKMDREPGGVVRKGVKKKGQRKVPAR